MKGLPSLDELSSGWLTRRRSLPLALPGLSGEIGSLQVEADISAIKHPIFPPYSGGNETSGVALWQGRPLALGQPEVAVRWSAYQILRKCRHEGLEWTSTSTLLPGDAGYAVRVRVRNISRSVKKGEIGLIVSGRARNAGCEGYAWSVPEIATDVFQMRDMHGLLGRHRLRPSSAETIWVSESEPVSTSHEFWPPPDRALNEQTVVWRRTWKPGGVFEFGWIGGLGATAAESQAVVRKWSGHFEEALEGQRAFWNGLWQSAFTPGNWEFSGHLPVLHGGDPAVRKLYYMGILTLLFLRRKYAGAKLETAYLTVGPRRGEGSIYLAWDLPYISGILARLDPEALWRHWELLAERPLFDHMVVNLFSGETVGFPCVAHPHALLAPVAELENWGRAPAWKNLVITRKGRPVQALPSDRSRRQGPELTPQRHKVGRILLEAVTAHRLFRLPKSALVDFGSKGNYLECPANYAHGTAGHTAVQMWALRRFGRSLGLEEKKDLAAMTAALRKLYRPGDGYFNCRYPDGSHRSAPNLYDLGLVLNHAGSVLSPKQVREITEFVHQHLATPTFARCLASFDPDALSSTRCDHQWAGCFPAWPAQFLRGIFRQGPAPDWTLDWIKGIAKVTAQGPFAQAYWAEDMQDPELGAAAKAPDELTQGNHWAISSGVYYAELVLDGIFGLDATPDRLVAQKSPAAPLIAGAVLEGVAWSSKAYHWEEGRLQSVANAKPAS